MKKILFILVCFVVWADLGDVSRAADTNDVRGWLTNTFRPWLVRSYPDVTAKVYPEWLHDHPPGLVPGPFTNWLDQVFPDLESETYPTWLRNVSVEGLGTNIPAWWGSVQKGRFSVSPAPQPVPSITRGPYLQMSTTNSVVVRWRTDLPSGSTVNYGSSPGRLSRSGRANGTFTDHAVQLTNLAPSTRYFYGVGATDTPLLVRWTNDVAFISSTNSKLYVNKPGTREQVAVGNKDTFVFKIIKKKLTVSDLDGTFTVNTTNTALVVNTPNNAVLVTAHGRALQVATTNHTEKLGAAEPGRAARNPGANFVVGTTNLIRTGGDSNTFFFTHPPIGTRQPTRIWVLGDPGTRKKAERDVRDAYYHWNGDRRTDLWLILGDIAYNSGKDAEYQGAIFQVYDTMLRKSVLWPALGNHDAGSANSAIEHGVYYDIFTMPSMGQAGGVMSGTEAFYSFDYANIHFLCIDSSDSSWSKDGTMLKWMERDLQANRQDWLIAFCHHPPYTRGNHDSDNDRDSDARMRIMRERVLPLLENFGLDLLLCGHSHSYERSFLVDGHYGLSKTLDRKSHFKSAQDGRTNGTGPYVKPTRGPAPHEGAVYVVAGSSGQISGGDLDHPVFAVSTNLLGSLVLDIDGHRLDATFVDDKAAVRDTFTILKGTERPAP